MNCDCQVMSFLAELGAHDLEGQALALDDAELAEVVPVVGGVDDVRVVQLPHLGQLAVQLRERKGQNEGGIHSNSRNVD